jgi:hypothetical protein
MSLALSRLAQIQGHLEKQALLLRRCKIRGQERGDRIPLGLQSVRPAAGAGGRSGPPAGPGERGWDKQVALAFSQQRESVPRHGAPRVFSIFFDLVLDPHHCRRHFRLPPERSMSSDTSSRSFAQCTQALARPSSTPGMTLGSLLPASFLARIGIWIDQVPGL